MTGEERDKEITTLANYFMDTVSSFGTSEYRKSVRSSCPRLINLCLQFRSTPRSGHNAMYLYLLTKAFYVLNIFLQILLLNHFLGEDYLHWGYQVR